MNILVRSPLGCSLVVLFAISCVAGCWNQPPAPPPSPAPRRPVVQPQPPSPPKAAPTPTEQPKPAKANRPDNVSDWLPSDYLAARKEGDPKLTEAVEQLIRVKRSDPSTIVLLGRLLETVPEEPSPDDPRSAHSRSYRGRGPAQLDKRVLQSILAILIGSEEDAARNILQQIVLGKLKTDDDSTATRAALYGLVKDSSPESEDVFFRALTVPETLRGEEDVRGESPYYAVRPMLPQDLQREAQQFVESMGSESLRLRLVKYLLDPKTPFEKIRQLRGVIEESHPDNLAAQIVLYQSDAPGSQTRKTLERLFHQQGATALAYILGIIPQEDHQDAVTPTPRPTPEMPRDRPSRRQEGRWDRASQNAWSAQGRQSDDLVASRSSSDQRFLGGLEVPEDVADVICRGRTFGGDYARTGTGDLHGDPQSACHVAEVLWQPEMANKVAQQLARVRQAEESTELLQLAKVLPVGAVREALLQLMQENWADGPSRMFRSSSMGGMDLMGMSAARVATHIEDPGLLLLFKMIPREESTAKRKGRNRSGRDRPEEQSAARIRIEQQWMKASEDLLWELCNQFHAAAINQPSLPPEAKGKLPIIPHTDTNITAQYDFVWPNESAKTSGAKGDPIEIHYLRIEENAQPMKLLSHYRRQTKSKGRDFSSKWGAWLDALDDTDQPDRKRSIDVLITRPEGPGYAAPPPDSSGRGDRSKASEPLVIQILTIETTVPPSE